jgi:hypothetical protein
MREFGILQGNRMYCGDRESFGGEARRQAYLITNQGARSVFALTVPTNAPRVTIADFDRFQENLLRHYSEYRRLLRADPPSQGGHSVPAN